MPNTAIHHADSQPRTREDILQIALLMACGRIANGPQEFHEANTVDGWADIFTEAAALGIAVDEVLASRPSPRQMTDADRASRGIPVNQ